MTHEEQILHRSARRIVCDLQGGREERRKGKKEGRRRGKNKVLEDDMGWSRAIGWLIIEKSTLDGSCCDGVNETVAITDVKLDGV